MSDVKKAIISFIGIEVGGIENIKGVEENCGTMWIDTNDGKTYSISVMECEPDEDDEFKHTREQFDTPDQD